MSRKTGGPAFPTPEFFNERQIGMTDGMLLRDYFAARALPFCLIKHDGDPVQATVYAYVIADAMIEEKDRT